MPLYNQDAEPEIIESLEVRYETHAKQVSEMISQKLKAGCKLQATLYLPQIALMKARILLSHLILVTSLTKLIRV